MFSCVFGSKNVIQLVGRERCLTKVTINVWLCSLSKTGLVSSSWERQYFFTQGGNLMQQGRGEVAGGLVTDLDNSSVMAVDSDDRRFCFQVTSFDGKKWDDVPFIRLSEKRSRRVWPPVVCCVFCQSCDTTGGEQEGLWGGELSFRPRRPRCVLWTVSCPHRASSSPSGSPPSTTSPGGSTWVRMQRCVFPKA